MPTTSPAAPGQEQEQEQEYQVTPLELLFDLVFAFGISQLSHHLLAHLSVRGVVETVVLLFTTIHVWAYTSWGATLIRAERATTRWMVLGVLLFGLFLNASIAWAFSDSGWAFVICLLVIQIGRTIWTIVYVDNAFYREHFVRVLYWFMATAILWILGAMADAHERLLWWGLATAIDVLGTWYAHPMPGRRLQSLDKPFDASHMLERCRLFLLIALGETIIMTGSAITDAGMTTMTAFTGAFALIGSIALWSLIFMGSMHKYSDQFQKETHDPLTASRKTVLAMLFLVAGLIGIAVANEKVIAHPHAEASVALSLLLAGGAMLFLATQAWYSHAVLGINSQLHWLGCLAMLPIGLITLYTPAYLSLMVVSTALAALTGWERLARVKTLL